MADFVGKIERGNVWMTGRLYTLLVLQINHIPMNMIPKMHYISSITIKKNESIIFLGTATITLELNRRDITGLHVFNQLSCIVSGVLNTSQVIGAEFYIDNIETSLNEIEVAEMGLKFANDMKTGVNP